jgi:hypothetical protein
MRLLVATLFLAGGLAVLPGCDVRALRLDELQNNKDGAAGRDGNSADDGEAAPPPPDGTNGDAEGDGSTGGDRVDAPRGCPAVPCASDEFCDVPTMLCFRRTGTGMLSGTVTSACTLQGLTARVGIAGRRQCAPPGKGSYYFDSLPEGDLALTAFKEGYKLFQTSVKITPGGNIDNIVLMPDTPGGCADPSPPEVACTCSLPGCP